MIGTENSEDMTENARSKRSSRWWLREDSQSLVIEAPAERIYALVADLPRMGDWSPECRQVEWLDGSTGPTEGATFVGHNRGRPRRPHEVVAPRQGAHRRPRPGVRLRHRRGRPGVDRVAVPPGARGGGTRVTESYAVHWIPTWARIVDVPTNRARELREAMQHTLEQLKGAAETPPSAH